MLMSPPKYEISAATTWLPIFSVLLHRNTEAEICWAITWVETVDEFWLPKFRSITKEDPLVWFSSPDRARLIITRAASAKPKATASAKSSPADAPRVAMEATKDTVPAIAHRIANGEITIHQAAEETGWVLRDGEAPLLIPEPDVVCACGDDRQDQEMYRMSTETTRVDIAEEYAIQRTWGNRHSVTIDTWLWAIDPYGEIVYADRQSHDVGEDVYDLD